MTWAFNKSLQDVASASFQSLTLSCCFPYEAEVGSVILRITVCEALPISQLPYTQSRLYTDVHSCTFSNYTIRLLLMLYFLSIGISHLKSSSLLIYHLSIISICLLSTDHLWLASVVVVFHFSYNK